VLFPQNNLRTNESYIARNHSYFYIPLNEQRCGSNNTNITDGESSQLMQNSEILYELHSVLYMLHDFILLSKKTKQKHYDCDITLITHCHSYVSTAAMENNAGHPQTLKTPS
jgi:hypothetical protein